MKTTQTTPDIPIVFEDQHLLIVNKPANMLSQEDHTGDPDVLNLCKEYLARSNPRSGIPFLGLVHRLDRPVSGLMLLAKTGRAAQNLSKQIHDRTIQKTYQAVVEGNPPPNGVLTHHLFKDRDKNMVSVVAADLKKAKEATLSFAKIAESGGLNLLSIHLQTGRPHQIRVQLAEEGYPIWGDYRYGSDQPDGRDIALRAVELILNHPSLGEQMQFEVTAPDEEPWSRF
ncbi:RluA family pseudouridine synthase [Fodinibius salsisoli]|uniref:RluA family pseudouridine synthase n=1 Tax=Fodinibius salsisoli TaxID=2820877 RepID=A0ABT3PKG1_9BACT|nr:RluA family pseudouridine synthase [Fodinibius salsisoli]MCW9706428.1 RluA family pseudouridine synthase [Fodinibius salsisoli]